MEYIAYKELGRIKDLSAFNIMPPHLKFNVNQHKVLYRFGDGSMLAIFPTSGKGVAWLIESGLIIRQEKIKINA